MGLGSKFKEKWEKAKDKVESFVEDAKSGFQDVAGGETNVEDVRRDQAHTVKTEKVKMDAYRRARRYAAYKPPVSASSGRARAGGRSSSTSRYARLRERIAAANRKGNRTASSYGWSS